MSRIWEMVAQLRQPQTMDWADPYPYYAWLRQEDPVCYSAALGTWVVAQHADVLHVLRTPDEFSSRINARQQPFAPENGPGGLRPESTLLGSDPPAHTRIRQALNRYFTRSRIRALEPDIRRVTRELLASIDGASQADLVDVLAIPLPIIVIAELLGIEPSRREQFRRWSRSLTSVGTDIQTFGSAQREVDGLVEFFGFLTEMIQERRRHPGTDLVSALVSIEDDPDQAGVHALSLAALFLVAGNETTSNLIGNMLLALLQHPEQLDHVRQGRASAADAVEEVLRYDPPVQFARRVTTRPVNVEGQHIPAGQPVMALIGSANRDEEVFPQADVLDVQRRPRKHLAFGAGAHLCLGGPLARLEATIALEEWIRLLPDMQLEAYEALPGTPPLRGPHELRVNFKR